MKETLVYQGSKWRMEQLGYPDHSLTFDPACQIYQLKILIHTRTCTRTHTSHRGRLWGLACMQIRLFSPHMSWARLGWARMG